MSKKRTRPGATRALLNDGQCCKPYPDARFVEGELVSVHAHHIGEGCNGYVNLMSLEDWNDEIAQRVAARSRSREDD